MYVCKDINDECLVNPLIQHCIMCVYHAGSRDSKDSTHKVLLQ